jgi:hypothetical protein
MNLPLEARLALEWMRASGPRNAVRLHYLVEHFCTVNAVCERGTRDAIYTAAVKAANLTE